MKLLRKILFPFSMAYGGITSIRNYFYDRGWLESKEYKKPIICVGNLTTGGTGKSPMIEYLISILKKDFEIAVLSRGYKRKTSGYKEVFETSTVEEVGDEPLQIKQNFPEVTVAVSAERRNGIEHLQTESDLILLDDAFQHRKVKASLNIVLTAFDNLYLEDYLLPTGNLRESRRGIERADIIVVTKCPTKVPYSKLQEIEFRIGLLPHQKIYFSRIGYDSQIFGKSESLALSYLKNKEFTLVTGIANPEPLIEFLRSKHFKFTHEKFPDHHNFSENDIRLLQKKDLIVTTEKDYMRLQPKLKKFALYYLPIKTIILKDQEDFFKEMIIDHINNKRLN